MPERQRFGIPWSALAFEFVVIGLLAAGVAVQLFVPPIVGVADNGDYHRVMLPLGLSPTVTEWPDLYFDHINLEYEIGEPQPAKFPTSEIPVGRLAVALSRRLGDGEKFDLRTLGAVNAALYLIGLGLIVTTWRGLGWTARVLGALLLLLAATDVTNVAFFNSFYSESATLAFLALMLAAALGLNRAGRLWLWQVLLFLAAGLAFAAAKPQNLPLAGIVVLLPLARLLRGAPLREWIVWGAGSLAVIAMAAALYGQVPTDIKQYNRWNVLVYSILPDSPDPQADLRELGLDETLARYSGQGAFAEGVPARTALPDLTHVDLARFLLRHPDRFVALAQRCAGGLYEKFDPVHGQFTKASGRAARTQSTDFAGWSGFQAEVLPRSLVWLGLQALAGLALIGWVWRTEGLRSRAGGLAWLGAGLGLMAAMQFGICLLGDGAYDIVKHLFLMQLLLDASAILGLMGLAEMLARRLGQLLGPDSATESRATRTP